MTAETLIALFGFASVASWTPGPNNAMLAASGANFGLRRSLPHVAGVVIGFSVMVLLVALGLGEAFRRLPLLGEALRWAGAALLLWFAWKIATAGGPGTAAAGRPLGFWAAAGFQWVNPKAWLMSAGVIGQFGGVGDPLRAALLIAGVFAAAGLLSSLAWAGFGAALRQWLATPGRLRAFNAAMGLLLAGFVLALLAG